MPYNGRVYYYDWLRNNRFNHIGHIIFKKKILSDWYCNLQTNKYYAAPSGMTKLISSANSPQATRFIWNMVIQTDRTMAHSKKPTVENITSESVNCEITFDSQLQRFISIQFIQTELNERHHCKILTFSNQFLFIISWLSECFIEEPNAVHSPNKWQTRKSH